MKKLVIVLVLATVLAAGTAFADHPDGFGIGFFGNYNYGWGGTGGGVGLSLKIPALPVYWGINLGFDSNYFALGVTGDFYIIDNNIAGPFHWYLGLGGFFNLWMWNNTYYDVKYKWNNIAGGLRVPVGFSIQPLEWLEVFFTISPSFGIWIQGEQKYTYQEVEHRTNSKTGFGFGFPVEIGLRFWP